MATSTIERSTVFKQWDKVEKAGKLLCAIFPPGKFAIIVRDGKIIINPLRFKK